MMTLFFTTWVVIGLATAMYLIFMLKSLDLFRIVLNSLNHELKDSGVQRDFSEMELEYIVMVGISLMMVFFWPFYIARNLK